ncbi:major facilitator superfamily domain-containing protein [Crucibulum laeve]|uniref:Major facilitator superfamily domain-containing protein n=1 Tax=Crucibulum laeve TaxID=68775 RepID=A0A5C3M8Y9_9AGAR|nr:major facilitator superfamily domain-containing protein [Crucibulum laeve]
MPFTSTPQPPAIAVVSNHPPRGLKWRSSYWFTTFVVGLGIATDLLVYSIIIPVMPFHLESLGYRGISSLTGWLLFAYSAGLVLSTIPIAMLSERYHARRLPLIIGLLVLIGSQVMLMEAPSYAVMCIARVLQGIGSSMVWVVGLALLCDSTPEIFIGRQLGIAMSGLSIGVMVGPPVGGALYERFGYRGPIVFGLIVTVLDLLGRLFIVERKDAILWGVDPAASVVSMPEDVASTSGAQQKAPESKHQDGPQHPPNSRPLSLINVVVRLCKSPRAVVAFVITLTYGLVYSSQEPSIPLHLQRVWGFDSRRVGLVFIAAVVPTLFSSPLAGYYSDKLGTGWTVFLCLSLSLPWWVVVIIQGRVELFIVAFAIENFFTSGTISPLTAELAAVSREIEGVGYAHVYGAFNIAYGIGTSVGPIVGGQMYDHLKHGWSALCLLATGILGVCLIPTFFFVGDESLFTKLKTRLKLKVRTSL